jgi:putrescine importer
LESYSSSDISEVVPELRRVLSLRDLIFYGIVSITPCAPVTVFGLASSMSRGHASLAILLAMIAILFTAVSYGRMAAVYPTAGSAYTYVGRGLNTHLGFLAGWAMLLDYIVIPLFCVMYSALTMRRVMPQVPYWVWALIFAAGITGLNLNGVRSTARANEILLGAMALILITFDVLAIRYIVLQDGLGGLFSLQPFYDPKTFQISAISSATSFAALTYLGFDAVTTLAEEVENPRRNVLLSMVIICLFTGIFGGLLIYLAQLVWPTYQTFPNPETAFMDVTRRIGGAWLFQSVGFLLVLAYLGSALTGQVGASRLLFSFGRDHVLPVKVFGHLDQHRRQPVYNVAILGLVAFLGSLFMRYELTAEILNFGAFLGFMGVNLAVIRQFYGIGQPGVRKSFLKDVVAPGLGFLFSLTIWLGLSRASKLAGSAWFIVGFVYLVFRTKGFRRSIVISKLSDIPGSTLPFSELEEPEARTAAAQPTVADG